MSAEVEQLRAENERLTKDMAEQLDDSERIIAALRERDEARAACTLAWQRICAERRWAYDPAMDPVEALHSRLDPESAFYEAFNLDSADAFAARAEKAERERDEALAAPGANWYVVAQNLRSSVEDSKTRAEKAERERERDEALKAQDEQLDDSERIIAALKKERDEARANLDRVANTLAIVLGVSFESARDLPEKCSIGQMMPLQRAEVERLTRELTSVNQSRDYLEALLAEREERVRRLEKERDALLAEVERLRGLILKAEWAAGESAMLCPWCERSMAHAKDCPAFQSVETVRR